MKNQEKRIEELEDRLFFLESFVNAPINQEKWYENIPDGGVLCWVTDHKSQINKKDAMRSVTALLTSKEGFKCDAGTWIYATPLTKQEIQVFLSNAPDEELK